MAKEKMVLFRTAFGGFNREDVNNYIEKLNREFAERERTAKKKADAADEKCKALEERIAELEADNVRISELENEAQTREVLIAEYIEKVEHQASEIETLRASKNSAEGEITKLTEEIASLSEAISKSEKYDDISNQIGEIILSARTTADGILAKAEEDATKKLTDTDAFLENAVSEFNNRTGIAASAIKVQMTNLASEAYSSLAQKAAETSDMLRNLATHISTVAENFGEELSSKNSEAEAIIAAEAKKIYTAEHKVTYKK